MNSLIPGATMLDGSFILATSAIHLISVVGTCLSIRPYLGKSDINLPRSSNPLYQLVLFGEAYREFSR